MLWALCFIFPPWTLASVLLRSGYQIILSFSHCFMSLFLSVSFPSICLLHQAFKQLAGEVNTSIVHSGVSWFALQRRSAWCSMLCSTLPWCFLSDIYSVRALTLTHMKPHVWMNLTKKCLGHIFISKSDIACFGPLYYTRENHPG